MYHRNEQGPPLANAIGLRAAGEPGLPDDRYFTGLAGILLLV